MTVAERNWRTASGEIDIVAWDGPDLVLVEVKTRRTHTDGHARGGGVAPRSSGSSSGSRARTSPRRARRPRLVRFDVVSLRVLGAGPGAAAPPPQRLRRAGRAEMQAVVETATLVGVEAVPVEVQADVGAGLPSFAIVGLGDAAVLEARERVRSAIRASGLSFPGRARHRQPRAGAAAQARHRVRPADRRGAARRDAAGPARTWPRAAPSWGSSRSTARVRAVRRTARARARRAGDAGSASSAGRRRERPYSRLCRGVALRRRRTPLRARARRLRPCSRHRGRPRRVRGRRGPGPRRGRRARHRRSAR